MFAHSAVTDCERPGPVPGTPVPGDPSRLRLYVDIGVVIAALAAANLIAQFTTAWANVVTVPAVAIGLLLLARARGLCWAELGLSRAHWRSGARYAMAAVGLVAGVIAIGALLPWTRPMFLNDHYATCGVCAVPRPPGHCCSVFGTSPRHWV